MKNIKADMEIFETEKVMQTVCLGVSHLQRHKIKKLINLLKLFCMMASNIVSIYDV